MAEPGVAWVVGVLDGADEVVVEPGTHNLFAVRQVPSAAQSPMLRWQ